MATANAGPGVGPPAVRAGSGADLPYVFDLGRRVVMTSVSSLRPAYPPVVEEAFDQLIGFCIKRDHELHIAERGRSPIGFALALYDLPDEVTLGAQAFLAYMAVEPEEQQRGVGRLLLQAVETAARARGLPMLTLAVTDENRAALNLYTAAGFVTERHTMAKRL